MASPRGDSALLYGTTDLACGDTIATIPGIHGHPLV